MSNISLTASMRSNLLSLQKTQSLMDTTQERLSTGKKVNSAIDNPSSYYTAQSLNNRANDLSALLDSMGQGIQTIKAADEAIKTITSFAEQAKAVANSARDITGNFDKYAITSNEIEEAITGGSFVVDSRADLSTFTMKVTESEDTAAKFTVYYGDGKISEIDLSKKPATGVTTVNYVVKQLQGLGLKASADETGVITVSSTDGSAVSWVNGTGVNGTTGDPTGGLKKADNDSAAKKVTLDATTGKNAATIAAAIDGTNKVDASPEGNTFSVQKEGEAFRIIAGDETSATTEAMEKLGIEGSRKAGKAGNPTAERTSYAKQFNSILEQIDALAADAGYKGVNLLQENNLKVIFNEDRSSKIEIKGVDASSKGLGITQAQNNWQKDSNIETSIKSIENAISKLRTMASDFGNNYSVVQSREEFTNNLINVLTEGADKLTLADMNEESANMLALQTRQQLAINSLSLASQAAQSVLKLF